MMIDVCNGVERVRAWPKKRGRNLNPKTQAQNDLFRECSWAIKYLPGIVQRQCAAAVAGTPLLPRDLMMQILYGRLFAVKLPDGRRIYPMAARQDISESLDILGQVPGMILIRGEDFWEQLALGDPFSLLSVNAAGDAVEWIDAATVQGIASATINTLGNRNNAAYGDLATVGPSVTLVTGTEALVTLSCIIQKNAGGAGFNGWCSVAVSGSTTLAAADANSIDSSSPGGGFDVTCSRTFKLTGLTPGSNTFTHKYKTNGAQFNFYNRDITVQALA